MIRPSALQLAEKCGLSAKLAADFPEDSEAAERGREIHASIVDAFKGLKPSTPEAAKVMEIVRATLADAELTVETKLRLQDPETGITVTEGTPDLVAIRPGGLLEIWDWKTGRPENVAPPDDNLQLWAYALAAALERDSDAVTQARVVLAFLDGDKLWAVPSETLEAADLWPMLERIKKAAAREPIASPGIHCQRCYSRHACPSNRERVKTALAILPNYHSSITMNEQTAPELLARAKAVREACDLAEEMVRAYVRAGGRVEADGMVYEPQIVAGRRSGPSVKDLEQAGLGHLVKEGKPSERWTWRRAG